MVIEDSAAPENADCEAVAGEAAIASPADAIATAASLSSIKGIRFSC
jgi:hypothetical protein